LKGISKKERIPTSRIKKLSQKHKKGKTLKDGELSGDKKKEEYLEIKGGKKGSRGKEKRGRETRSQIHASEQGGQLGMSSEKLETACVIRRSIKRNQAGQARRTRNAQEE